MNANDVIEAYVHDVARQLPRRQRNDVAFELRALLREELQARADEAGQAAEADMAIALVRDFGQPDDVAARYRPALTIIDPVDGQRFLRATVIGLAVIWVLGLLTCLRQPLDSGTAVLRMLGQWWSGTVMSSLWWPGLLAIGFGGAAWARRRWPQGHAWTPRNNDRIPGGRTAMVMVVISIFCGIGVLIDPRWILDMALHGRAAPAAYDALTYTDTFRHRQGPCLLAALLLNLPMMCAVIVHGRWTPRLRQFELALGLVTCALMLWAALDGTVFVGEASDRTVKFMLVLLTVISLGSFGLRWYHGVRPTPAPRTHALH